MLLRHYGGGIGHLDNTPKPTPSQSDSEIDNSGINGTELLVTDGETNSDDRDQEMALDDDDNHSEAGSSVLDSDDSDMGAEDDQMVDSDPDDGFDEL
jgi:hypothetical protein